MCDSVRNMDIYYNFRPSEKPENVGKNSEKCFINVQASMYGQAACRGTGGAVLTKFPSFDPTYAFDAVDLTSHENLLPFLDRRSNRGSFKKMYRHRESKLFFDFFLFLHVEHPVLANCDHGTFPGELNRST